MRGHGRDNIGSHLRSRDDLMSGVPGKAEPKINVRYFITPECTDEAGANQQPPLQPCRPDESRPENAGRKYIRFFLHRLNARRGPE